MSARSHHLNANSPNPATIDWAAQDLPNAWPDLINWLHPRSLWMVANKVTGRSRGRVVLPPDLPGMERIPKYVLQEFHNLPNGNYSKRICQGYARSFEPMMLGTLRQGRERLAQALKGANHVLDLGCGSGGSIPVLRAAGAPSIWGPGAFGRGGVGMVPQTLRREPGIAMKQAGTVNVRKITRAYLVNRHA